MWVLSEWQIKGREFSLAGIVSIHRRDQDTATPSSGLSLSYLDLIRKDEFVLL